MKSSLNKEINDLSFKFKSGNDVPVTSAKFSPQEWQVVLNYIVELEDSITNLRKQHGDISCTTEL